MGCTSSAEVKLTLKHHLQRLKVAASHERNKLEKKVIAKEKLLSDEFRKDRLARNKAIEESIIQEVVYNFNVAHFWTVAENCSKKILDYYSVLEKKEDLKHIGKELQTLLFLNSMLNSEDLNQIYRILTKKYKMQEPVTTDNNVINYHKKSARTSEKMRNDYILGFGSRENIEISKINDCGHTFQFGL